MRSSIKHNSTSCPQFKQHSMDNTCKSTQMSVTIHTADNQVVMARTRIFATRVGFVRGDNSRDPRWIHLRKDLVDYGLSHYVQLRLSWAFFPNSGIDFPSHSLFIQVFMKKEKPLLGCERKFLSLHFSAASFTSSASFASSRRSALMLAGDFLLFRFSRPLDGPLSFLVPDNSESGNSSFFGKWIQY